MRRDLKLPWASATLRYCVILTRGSSLSSGAKNLTNVIFKKSWKTEKV